jgi:hypothetical protein
MHMISNFLNKLTDNQVLMIIFAIASEFYKSDIF